MHVNHIHWCIYIFMIVFAAFGCCILVGYILLTCIQDYWHFRFDDPFVWIGVPGEYSFLSYLSVLHIPYIWLGRCIPCLLLLDISYYSCPLVFAELLNSPPLILSFSGTRLVLVSLGVSCLLVPTSHQKTYRFHVCFVCLCISLFSSVLWFYFWSVDVVMWYFVLVDGCVSLAG